MTVTIKKKLTKEKVLVHIHIYYAEMWPELKKCVEVIAGVSPCDLFVTMVKEHKDIIQDIQSLIPNATISLVKNRGFDVGPFFFCNKQS